MEIPNLPPLPKLKLIRPAHYEDIRSKTWNNMQDIRSKTKDSMQAQSTERAILPSLSLRDSPHLQRISELREKSFNKSIRPIFSKKFKPDNEKVTLKNDLTQTPTKRRRIRNRPRSSLLLCHICGETASNHSYYGAQARPDILIKL